MVIRGTTKIPVGGTGSTEEALNDLAKMLWELDGKKGTLEQAEKDCRTALGIAKAEKDCKTALGIARKEIKDRFGVKFV